MAATTKLAKVGEAKHSNKQLESASFVTISSAGLEGVGPLFPLSAMFVDFRFWIVGEIKTSSVLSSCCQWWQLTSFVSMYFLETFCNFSFRIIFCFLV